MLYIRFVPILQALGNHNTLRLKPDASPECNLLAELAVALEVHVHLHA